MDLTFKFIETVPVLSTHVSSFCICFRYFLFTSLGSTCRTISCHISYFSLTGHALGLRFQRTIPQSSPQARSGAFFYLLLFLFVAIIRLVKCDAGICVVVHRRVDVVVVPGGCRLDRRAPGRSLECMSAVRTMKTCKGVSASGM
jgi:hypothetical protein